MRKLIGGQYVRVEGSAMPVSDPVQAEVNYADVLDAADIEEMDKDQLIAFLQDQGLSANKRWKEDTLRHKAHAVIRGEA